VRTSPSVAEDALNSIRKTLQTLPARKLLGRGDTRSDHFLEERRGGDNANVAKIGFDRAMRLKGADSTQCFRCKVRAETQVNRF
jgi:hypothetical protein